MATVYRFEVFDGNEFVASRRLATLERIAEFHGMARKVGEGIEVPDSDIGREIDGMTAKGYTPPKKS